MTAHLNACIKIKPWLVGVLLSAAGMFLGYDLGSETAALLGGEPGIWSRLGKGFVWGGVIAGLQWPVVRVAGVRPLWFLPASAVGFAVGYPLGQTIQGSLIGLHWIWGYGSALAMFGLSLGLPQWWMFRRRMQRASLWIFFSVIGWIIAGAAWLNTRAGSGEDAVAYGLVTGLGLVWLARSRTLNAAGNKA